MTKRNNKTGIILSYLVALIPAVLWIVGHPSSGDFVSLQTSLDGIAKLLGIAGASLFAWNLILSARIGWLEKQFGGLDKLYKIHHIIGGLAFIAMLFHPLVLSIKYATLSLISAYNFILPSLNDLGLLAGKLVLGGMVVVLFITFYIYVSHERFVWIHRLTGVLYVVAVYHFLFVAQSDVRQIPFLFGYLGALSAIAVGLFGYRYFAKSLKPRCRYELTYINSLGDAWEIVLKPLRQGLTHTAGQFAFVSFPGTQIQPQVHPFSISSAEGATELRFVIKNLGDYTSTLGGLKPGDVAFIEGPYGGFSYRNTPAQKQIWVAGGIGITPFLSMARTIVGSDSTAEVHMFYSVADRSEAYFADELAKLASASQQNLTFHLHDSSKSGFLTADIIAAQVKSLDGYAVLLCGPGGMMRAMRQQFVAHGVDNNNIDYEDFSLL